MVRSETPRADSDQSLGDLVALAAKDVSQLVRYEIELAKSELRADLRRIGLAGAMGGFSFYVGTVVFVLLCFAYAAGLIAAGVWAWAAFLIVAGTCVVLAALVAGIAYLKVRSLSGLRLTKKTVTDDLDMLRREGLLPEAGPDGQRPEVAAGQRPVVAAGQRPEIPARKPR
jgi:Putative Actinobacterial Holin-X, holin superfamily III